MVQTSLASARQRADSPCGCPLSQRAIGHGAATVEPLTKLPALAGCAVLALSFLASGCGQKGPLRLERAASEPTTNPTPPARPASGAATR